MESILVAISLGNPLANDVPVYYAEALIDMTTMHLCIPQHIVFQLKLKQLEEREMTIADGSKRLVPYVGPVQITFKNRNCFTGAMVLGEEVLLGAIPMEDMDLIVQPALLKVTVNPQSPNMPTSAAK